MNYNDLRHFADSWGLLTMALVFVVCCAWAFLPRNRQRNDDAAHSIFKEDGHNG